MKKFTFHLETLLKVRLMKEEEMQIKLAQASQLYIKEKEYEEILLVRYQETTQNFRDKQQDVLTIETLKSFQYFLDKIKGDLFLQAKRVEDAAEHKAQALKELEEAIKSRKLVDKLKEKKWQQYQEQVLREEQSFLDELGTQMYAKNG